MQPRPVIEATCPDCRGPLSEDGEGEFPRYRCLVGHTYTARALLQAHSEAQERALWGAVVALEETSNLARVVAAAFSPEMAERLTEQARRKTAQAEEIRKVLQELEPFQTG
jgi:two-component system chemotaxis response regulator CheB